MKKLSRFLGTVLVLLSCSAVAAAPFTFELPEPYAGGGGNRYAFIWQGELQGFAEGSPYDKFNGEKFTLSGFYFSNGTFDFTRMDFVGLPDPEVGGGGNLVALPNPAGGGPGGLFMPSPEGGGGGSIIALIPRIEIDPLVPGSALTARFLSIDFDGTATNPTVSTYSYKSAPVPEPSTILLFAAGLASLTAINRRKNSSPQKYLTNK